MFQFFVIFSTDKIFCRMLCFLILQRTRLNYYYCLIEFGYHCLCDIMWCDNLPRKRGRLSQLTSPYKLFINNHSVTFERNPILFNGSQEFTQNFGTAFLKIKRERYKSLQTKSVTTSSVYPIRRIYLDAYV